MYFPLAFIIYEIEIAKIQFFRIASAYIFEKNAKKVRLWALRPHQTGLVLFSAVTDDTGTARHRAARRGGIAGVVQLAGTRKLDLDAVIAMDVGITCT